MTKPPKLLDPHSICGLPQSLQGTPVPQGLRATKKKTRGDLPEAVDPATFKYIKQITGAAPAFSPSVPSDASKLSSSQQSFIRHYVSSGGITKIALAQSSSTRKELEAWKTEPIFQKELRDAQEDWVEELRKAAMLRATAKSDILLMFLLKAMRPDVFDEDVRKQHYTGLTSSRDNIPVRATLVRDNTFNVSISSEQAGEIRDILLASESIESIESSEDRMDDSKEPTEDNI